LQTRRSHVLQAIVQEGFKFGLAFAASLQDFLNFSRNS
jgi:hypothetical protein